MSTDPPNIAPADQPPLEETEKTPLIPGKWYGIFSIVCALEPILVIGYVFLVYLLVIYFGIDISPPSGIIEYISIALFFSSPLFVIAGIVFGIWGRKTEGRRYANIGLVLSSLSALLVLTGIGFVVYSILVPCC